MKDGHIFLIVSLIMLVGIMISLGIKAMLDNNKVKEANERIDTLAAEYFDLVTEKNSQAADHKDST